MFRTDYLFTYQENQETMKNVNFISKKEFLENRPQYENIYKRLFYIALVVIYGFIAYVIIDKYSLSETNTVLISIPGFFIFLASILIDAEWSYFLEIEKNDKKHKIVRNGNLFGIVYFKKRSISILANIVFNRIEEVCDNLYIVTKKNKQGILRVNNEVRHWIQTLDKVKIEHTQEKKLTVIKNDNIIREIDI